MRTDESRHCSAMDVRCKACRILLARMDDSGLTIRRGELQVTVDGDFHVSIVCYRPRCQILNVLNFKTNTGPTGDVT